MKKTFFIYINIILISSLILSCSSTRKINPDFSSVVKDAKTDISKYDTTYLEQRARDHFVRGSSYQQQYRFAEAILEFQEALKYDSSAVILYAIAKNYLYLEKYDQALSYSIKSFEKDSTFIPNIEIMGEAFIQRGDYQKASKTYKQLYELAPTPENRMKLARLLETQDIDNAIKLYEESLAGNDDYNTLLRLAILYKQKKDNDKFMLTVNRLFFSYPNANTGMIIIESLLEAKKYNDAYRFLDTLDKTLSSTDIVQCYAEIASSLIEEKDTLIQNENIPRLLQRIDNRFIFDWRIQLLSGILAGRVRDSLSAEKFYQQGMKITDTIPEIPLQYGLFYIQNNNNKSAIEILKPCVLKFPNERRFMFFLGLAYVNLDSNHQAIPLFKNYLQIDNTNADVYSNLGLIYDRMKKYDSCDYFYEIALKIEPTNAQVNNNYAYSLSERGINLKKALEMSKTAIETDSTNSAYLDTYGWIQFRMGNIELGLEFVLKSIEKGEATAEVYEHLGDIYIMLERKEEAIEAWKTALQKDKNRASTKERLEKNK